MDSFSKSAAWRAPAAAGYDMTRVRLGGGGDLGILLFDSRKLTRYEYVSPAAVRASTVVGGSIASKLGSALLPLRLVKNVAMHGI